MQFKFQIEILIKTFTTLTAVPELQNKWSVAAALPIFFYIIVSSLEMKKWLMVQNDRMLSGPGESWEKMGNEREREKRKTCLFPGLSKLCSSLGKAASDFKRDFCGSRQTKVSTPAQETHQEWLYEFLIDHPIPAHPWMSHKADEHAQRLILWKPVVLWSCSGTTRLTVPRVAKSPQTPSSQRRIQWLFIHQCSYF